MFGALLGGIGLFMLGMLLLTDGLQAVAGDRLRTALRRYTRTRLSSIVSGAVVTTLVQSSSATTLAVIGFVGAGLLTFTQAIGIVFGANLGTTTTAWIVSAIGLKVKVDVFAMPLVGVGALAKLFGTGRVASIGTAVAGFGLIFVGIDVLQGGMAGLTDKLDPASFASPGVLGYALLVGVGLVMTVVMQSSSAAVATTLAAVASGTVSLEQAAALVIGQNMGTTVTAAVGSIGGSSAARRTALAHVLFNGVTGLVALLMLPAFVWLVREATEDADAPTQLAAFHTAFNLLGVLMFAPFMGPFARFIERRIPEKSEALTRRLAVGKTLQPSVLLEAARATLKDITLEAVAVVELLRAAPKRELTERLDAISAALVAVRESVAPLRSDPASPNEHRQHVSVLHAVDHLHRLVEAFAETGNARQARERGDVAPLLEILSSSIEHMKEWLATPNGAAPDFESPSREIAELRRGARAGLLTRTAKGELTPAAAESVLEAMRWVDRLGYHLWRTLYHLEAMEHEVAEPLPPAPESQGRRGEEPHEL